MTPEEWAHRLLHEPCGALGIVDIVRAILAEEREACAKEADAQEQRNYALADDCRESGAAVLKNAHMSMALSAHSIAAAIRARP